MAINSSSELERHFGRCQSLHQQRPTVRHFSLRRYAVFNAEQIDGVPPLKASETLFDPVSKAEAVIPAIKEKTDLLVVHGGTDACYVPASDEIRLPTKSHFIAPMTPMRRLFMRERTARCTRSA